jgi:hypothetical protein
LVIYAGVLCRFSLCLNFFLNHRRQLSYLGFQLGDHFQQFGILISR